jgi:tetratricopeptide (TPR) repeat protein
MVACILRSNPEKNVLSDTCRSVTVTRVTELKGSSHMAQAIDVLKLEIQTYSDAGDAYAALADAHQKTGEKQLAIENYKKVIEKNPNDSGAKEKLSALEASPAAK